MRSTILPPAYRVEDHFTYAIRLANGTLSWATVTIQLTGTNDAPVVTGAVTGTATEDAADQHAQRAGQRLRRRRRHHAVGHQHPGLAAGRRQL